MHDFNQLERRAKELLQAGQVRDALKIYSIWRTAIRRSTQAISGRASPNSAR